MATSRDRRKTEGPVPESPKVPGGPDLPGSPVPDPHGQATPERSAQEADTPPLEAGSTPTPWVSASELQPHEGKQRQRPMDVVDETGMESFPASDPPTHSRRVRDEDVIPAGAPLEPPFEPRSDVPFGVPPEATSGQEPHRGEATGEDESKEQGGGKTKPGEEHREERRGRSLGGRRGKKH